MRHSVGVEQRPEAFAIGEGPSDVHDLLGLQCAGLTQATGSSTAVPLWRALRAIGLVAALMLVGIGLMAAPASAQTMCTPSGTNPATGEAFDQCVAFTFTGSEQTFTVPDNVAGDDIQIKVWGASGASGFFANFAGHGAFGRGIITANAGDAYTIIVGEGGEHQRSGAKTGGFGGGGLSGIPTASLFAGNGGGFSGVHLNDAYVLLMAGGGSSSVSNHVDGGSGGIAQGFDGGATISNRFIANFPQAECAIGAGKGASQTAGGARGVSDLALDNATDGSALQGGTGGRTQTGQPGTGDSGGGGGGLFGGGGGIGSAACDDNAGGGGSSFIAGAVTDVFTEARAVRDVDAGPKTAGPGAADAHYDAVSGLTPGLAPDPAPDLSAASLNAGAPGNHGLVIMQWTEAAPVSVPATTDVCTNRNLPLGARPDIWWDANDTAGAFPVNVEENNIPNVISNAADSSPISAGPGLTFAPAGFAQAVSAIDATTLEEARVNEEFVQFSFDMQPDFISYIEGWTTFGRSPGITNLAIDIATQPDFSDAVNIFDGAPSAAGGGFRQLDTAAQVLLPGQRYHVRFYFYGFSSGGFDSLGFEISSCADTGDSTLDVAAHRQPDFPVHHLGTVAPDIDPFTPGNANATADDTTGTDDEDGVNIPVLIQGGIATGSAEVTGADGFLQGWIDFNGDGTFEDSEQIATDLQDDDGDGTIDIIMSVPPTASTSQTFARFRWSTISGLTATAPAPDGEVEDYAVTIQENALLGEVPSNPIGLCTTNWHRWVVSGQVSRAPAGTNPLREGAFGLADTTRGPDLWYTPLLPRDTTDPILSTQLGLASTAIHNEDPRGGGAGVGEIFYGVTTFEFEPGIMATLPLTDFGFIDGHAISVFDSAGNQLARFPSVASAQNDVFYIASRRATLPSEVTAERRDPAWNDTIEFQVPADGRVFVHHINTDERARMRQALAYCPQDVSNAPAYDVASHIYNVGLMIGANKDVDVAPANILGPVRGNGTATDDNADGSSDQDGVASFADLTTTDTAYSVEVSVSNTGADATLYGWIDLDNSDTFDAAEFASVAVPAGTAGTVTVNWTGLTGLVGGDTFARFRLTTDVLTGADAALDASDGEVEDYAVTISAGTITVSGTIFFDNGTGAGATAHNGLIEGDEAGAGAVTVEAFDASATLVARAQTGADGTYTLTLPSSADGTVITIRTTAPSGTRHISGMVTGATDADTDDGEVVFTAAIGTATEFNFGIVAEPRLTLDQSRAIGPGGAVAIAHTFTAETAMSVDFGLLIQSETPADIFATAVFHDADCNGVLDASETALTGTQNLVAGEQVCVLVRTSAPTGFSGTATLAYNLVADASFAGTSQTAQLTNTDTLTGGEIAGLKLTKEVCNLSVSTCNLATGSGFAASNAGAPGDRLVYRIVFSTIGPEPVDDVAIFDQTPAFSSLSAAPPSVTRQPTGLTCTPTVPAVPVQAYEGVLEWRCAGAMAPGAEGVVSFEVQISQ